MAKRTTGKVLTVHVEYGENQEHTTFTIRVPQRLSKKLCLFTAYGMLFESSWVLDDSNGHDWSIWLDGKCIEAHGEHCDFADMPESDVPWLYGEPV